ncbi:MAG TPA: YidC/Oxa1 family membrane protein insertase [Candidatus Paceibacterota bacterium]
MWSIIVAIYNEVFYRPLLNGLFLLTAYMPGESLGLAVIVLTIAIRLVIFPLNHKMIKTQRAMKQIEPEIKRIQSEKKNREDQAKALMELYRAHGINPLSGIFALFIQLPLLFALFYVFRGDLAAQSQFAYSFVRLPENVDTLFLGLIVLTKPHVVMAALAGLSQFFQAKLATPPSMQNKGAAASDGKPDFASIMQKQMVFLFPVMIFIFSIQMPSAVALYWTVMNLFAIVHEAVVRRRATRNIVATTAISS